MYNRVVIKRATHSDLSSDSYQEAPHGLIGRVMFSATTHLKRQRYSITFNLIKNKPFKH